MPIYTYVKIIKRIIFIFFLISIKYHKCGTPQNSLEYKYPNAIELNNGNVLIVFSTGIYVYNSNLTELIGTIEYESESGITIEETDLNLINLSKFEDGLIISIIKTYLYIFSSIGEYIYHINLSENLEGGTYYSLVPHKIEEKNYYYAITYMENKKLKILYYYINIPDNSDKGNYLIDSLEYSHTDSSYPSYTIYGGKGLTCQLMSPSNEDNVLTCFYEISSPNGIAATSFQLDNQISQSTIQIVYQTNEQPGYFKSATTNDKTKALICYSKNGQGGYCVFYNIINNSFSEHKKYFKTCKDEPRSSHVDYFSKTKEFIYSCSDSGMGLTIMKFDEDGNAIDYNNTDISPNYYFSGFGLYSYSILFLPKYSKYSLLLSSSSNYICDIYLLPENFNPSNIYDINEETKSDSLNSQTTVITTIQKEDSETNNIDNYQTAISTYNSEMELIEKSETSITDFQTEISTYNSETELIEESETITTDNYQTEISTYNFETEIILESETTDKYQTEIPTNNFPTELSDTDSLMTSIKTDDNNNYIECSTFKNSDIKCLYCNEESLKLNKCVKCNNKLGYYPIIYMDNEDKYEQCYNDETKLNNFYFDSYSKSYKLCYELCSTCDNGGNGIENNCTSCISGLILKPDSIPPSNCVLNCSYYYYTSFGQYRCTENGQCPVDNNLLVRSKTKCVNNCSNDSFYKYQYNSECLEVCPDNTNPNKFNICEDKDSNICTLGIFKLNLNLGEFKTSNIELTVSNYINEYLYTNNHISQFDNDFFRYILFKNNDCIDELSLNYSTIDLGSCYNKIQSFYNTTEELIISIMNIKSDKNKPVTLYEVFEPKYGNKIDIEKICQNQTIIIKESVCDYLESSKTLISKQNIDIFNLSGSFYTDICYHFESLNGKDVPLKDRILSFYPNISLCDDGCTYRGVDLETFKTECECIINNFLNNYSLINGFLYDTIINDAIDLVRETNILVLKCYKDLFYSKYYIKNKGSFILISFIIIQIIITFIYFFCDLFTLKKYIYNLTDNYIIYINQAENKNTSNPPIKNRKIISINDDSSKKQIKNEITIYEKNANSSKSIIIKKTNNIIINSRLNSNSNKELIIKKNNKTKKNYNSENYREKDFEKYLSTSLDDLDFNEAFEKDKRKFCKLLIDLINNEHLIFRTFFNTDNVRPKSIKILLFILIINLYFVCNALLYNEKYISELYNSNEKENFFFFLKNSFYRLLSVSVINIIISYLIEFYFVDEKRIKQIFLRNKGFGEIKYKIAKLIKNIDKKFKAFIIISYLITVTSWYYIFCFNNVYPNTSLNWIKSTIFIITLIQLLSFLYIFLECVLRRISFKCNNELFFKLSKLLSD